MVGLLQEAGQAFRQRRAHVASKATVSCEALEGRTLLSMGFGNPPFFGGGFSPRTAEVGSWRGGGFDARYGGGMGFGRGMNDVSSLLVMPLLAASNGQTGFSMQMGTPSSAVQQAMQTLQTDLQNDTPSGATATHESVGALQDDLQAIRKGTLSGSAAQTKIESDQAAILSSMGLTQTQISQIQSDAQAVVSAIQSSASSTSGTSSSTTISATGTSSTSSSASAVKTAFQTLETDLKNDTTSGSRPTHASIGAVQDDLDAIRKGTLSGSAAVTKVQSDAAAVLSSMGLSASQVSQIQSDQQAVASAIQANSSTSTSSTSSSTTASTLQSVAQYVVGLPGLPGAGLAHGGMRGAMAFGFHSGPRGLF